MRKLATVCALFLSAMAALSGVAAAAEPIVIDRVVAIVGGEAITLSEVTRDVELLQGHTATSKSEVEIYRAALDERIERAVLRKRLATAGIRVTDEEVDGAVGDVARQAGVPKEKISVVLEREGITLPEYKDRVRDQIAKSKVMAMEIRPRTVVNDEKAKQYYDAHPGDFARPASAHLADIFFAAPEDAPRGQREKAEKQAESALARIRGGEAFEDVAREVSEGPTAKGGGDIGTFKSGELVAELEKAISGLAVGEVSEPVYAGGGVHVLKLVAREDAGPRPFSEVAEKIRSKLAEPELAKNYEAWLSKQKDEMFVEELVKPEEMARGAKRSEAAAGEPDARPAAPPAPAEASPVGEATGVVEPASEEGADKATEGEPASKETAQDAAEGPRAEAKKAEPEPGSDAKPQAEQGSEERGHSP